MSYYANLFQTLVALTPHNKATVPLIEAPQEAPKIEETPHAPNEPQIERVAIYYPRPDENLWDIAEHFLGSTERWTELIELNGIKPERGNPNLIKPGSAIQIKNPTKIEAPPIKAQIKEIIVSEGE